MDLTTPFGQAKAPFLGSWVKWSIVNPPSTGGTQRPGFDHRGMPGIVKGSEHVAGAAGRVAQSFDVLSGVDGGVGQGQAGTHGSVGVLGLDVFVSSATVASLVSGLITTWALNPSCRRWRVLCAQAPPEVVDRIEALRREHKWSAARIALELASEDHRVSARTVGRWLECLGINRRRHLDTGGESNRRPGRIIARYPGLCFNRLKQLRALATRFTKRAAYYSELTIATIILWLRDSPDTL